MTDTNINKFLNDENLKVVWKNIDERFVRKSQTDGYDELDLSNGYFKTLDLSEQHTGQVLGNTLYFKEEYLNEIKGFLKSTKRKIVTDNNIPYIVVGDYFEEGEYDENNYFVYRGFLIKKTSGADSKIYYLNIYHTGTVDDPDFKYQIIFDQCSTVDRIPPKEVKNICNDILK